MKIVLIGIQGSGKSTQGNFLSEKLHLPYLSTGHIFRQMAQEKTPLGRYIKDTINAGILIPDEKTIAIVNEYLSRDEYKNGYILDGFPRTLDQATGFINHVDTVIYLKVPDNEALWRIAHRNDITRDDETLIAIKKRIELFHKFTDPVIEYYRQKNMLFEIRGTKSIQEINQLLMIFFNKVFGKEGFNNWEKKRQQRKILLAIVGLAGSGKTEAADFFVRKGLPKVSFSNIINDYIDENKLQHTEEVHKKLREDFRKKYGMESMAVLSKDKIKKSFKKSPLVVIEGLYSWEEYLYLKKEFSEVEILLISIFAEKTVRYERVNKRKYRVGLGGRDRDIHELTKLNKAVPIAFADYTILNRGTLNEMFEKLEGIYRKVYYGIL